MAKYRIKEVKGIGGSHFRIERERFGMFWKEVNDYQYGTLTVALDVVRRWEEIDSTPPKYHYPT